MLKKKNWGAVAREGGTDSEPVANGQSSQPGLFLNMNGDSQTQKGLLGIPEPGPSLAARDTNPACDSCALLSSKQIMTLPSSRNTLPVRHRVDAVASSKAQRLVSAYV